MILKVGDVMYNPEYNGLHEIRKLQQATAVISGCCEYFNDTKTVITEKLVPIGYILNNLIPIQKCEGLHLVMCPAVGTYRVREVKPAYKFYKDPRIIKAWNKR